MKKFLLGTLVMIAGLIAGVLALTAIARAETGGVVMIHINQDFIAGGEAFFPQEHTGCIRALHKRVNG
jgi:hypothetical protein